MHISAEGINMKNTRLTNGRGLPEISAIHRDELQITDEKLFNHFPSSCQNTLQLHLGGGEVFLDCGGGVRPRLGTSAGLQKKGDNFFSTTTNENNVKA